MLTMFLVGPICEVAYNVLQQILNDVRKESSIIEIGILIFYGSIAEAYIIDYRSILYAYKLYCRSIEEIILYGKSEFNLYFVSIKSDQLAIKEKFRIIYSVR